MTMLLLAVYFTLFFVEPSGSLPTGSWTKAPGDRRGGALQLDVCLRRNYTSADRLLTSYKRSPPSSEMEDDNDLKSSGTLKLSKLTEFKAQSSQCCD